MQQASQNVSSRPTPPRDQGGTAAPSANQAPVERPAEPPSASPHAVAPIAGQLIEGASAAESRPAGSELAAVSVTPAARTRTGAPSRNGARPQPPSAKTQGDALTSAASVEAGAADRPAGQRWPLAAVLAAAASGMVVDRAGGGSLGAWLIVTVAAWGAWRLAWKRRRAAAAACLLVAVAALAAAWHHLRWNLFSVDELALFARESAYPVALEVVALEAPRHLSAARFDPLRAQQLGPRSRLTVAAVAIRAGRQWQRAAGRAALLVEGQLLGVHAGDRLLVFARLDRVAAPMNPGQYDFAAHARGDRQLARLWCEHPECVALVARGPRWSLRRIVDDLRLRLDAALWRHLSRERAGLASAALLGLREQLDGEQRSDFLETGTVHLLVISGTHVAILAGSLWLALGTGLLPRRAALAAVAAAVGGYAVLTDAQAPVVRGATAVILAAAAGWWGRRPTSFNTLAAAALLVVALNPADLFRTGPQLSFLCVAALAATAAHLARPVIDDPLAVLLAGTRPWPVRLARRGFGVLYAAVALSLAVWLVTLPLVAARFHLCTPLAVPLNVALALPLAASLASGLGVIVAALVCPPAAAPCAWVCDGCLGAIEGLVAGAARLAVARLWVPGPPEWWVAGFYLGLAAWMVAPRLRPPRRWCLALAAVWVAVPLTASGLARGDGPLRCTWLSLGHGLSAVVEMPDGSVLVYDAGQLGSPERATQTVSQFLWSRGKRRIDAVVLSHADIDHYNGLPGLLERFQVGAVFVSPMMFEARPAAVEALLASLAEHRTPVHEIWAGDRLRLSFGGASSDSSRRGRPGNTAAAKRARPSPSAARPVIEVLFPPRRGVLGSDNANSVVLEIEYQGQRVLLTGDLESPGLEALLAEEPRDCDVLLAPHHGSPRSDPPGLAAWCRPELLVVSGARSTLRGGAGDVLARSGVRVMHTAEVGAVEIAIRQGALFVSTFRDPTP